MTGAARGGEGRGGRGRRRYGRGRAGQSDENGQWREDEGLRQEVEEDGEAHEQAEGAIRREMARAQPGPGGQPRTEGGTKLFVSKVLVLLIVKNNCSIYKIAHFPYQLHFRSGGRRTKPIVPRTRRNAREAARRIARDSRGRRTNF